MNYLPDEISSLLQSRGSIGNIKPVGGGCINNGARITIRGTDYFVKWNDRKKFPGMFTAEARGLQLLADAECIRIPNVVEVLEGETYSALLLEYIVSRRTSESSDEEMGRQLACLHQNKQDRFGLDHDNYMGSLPQKNTWQNSLTDFVIRDRWVPQLDIGKKSGAIPGDVLDDFERLQARLPSLLIEESPSLVHGDLWSGNYMIDEQGKPVLIDPAVAYGHREMDIAMTTLFGGFAAKFYEAYDENYPLAGGYRERLDLYNLYPLLVHVNLFGGGYLNQVRHILRKFLK